MPITRVNLPRIAPDMPVLAGQSSRIKPVFLPPVAAGAVAVFGPPGQRWKLHGASWRFNNAGAGASQGFLVFTAPGWVQFLTCPATVGPAATNNVQVSMWIGADAGQIPALALASGPAGFGGLPDFIWNGDVYCTISATDLPNLQIILPMLFVEFFD